MSLFHNLEFNSLEDLLVNQLEDLYDAENRIVKALPDMAEAASSVTLKRAFEAHLEQTRGHVARLEQAFGQLGIDPKGETCDAMKGLLKEGEHVIDAEGDPDVKDAGLIAAAQRVEHYEIAVYGSARTFATQLGYPQIASLLQATLREEEETDKKLTQVAETEVNLKATH